MAESSPCENSEVYRLSRVNSVRKERLPFSVMSFLEAVSNTNKIPFTSIVPRWLQRVRYLKTSTHKNKTELIQLEVSEKMCLLVIWENRPFKDAPMQLLTMVTADITDKKYLYQYSIIFTAVDVESASFFVSVCHLIQL